MRRLTLRPALACAALAALLPLCSLPAAGAVQPSAQGAAAADAPTPPAQELRFKMESPRVRELQVRLRQAKLLAVVDVEDRFGQLTREAVIKLQKDAGLRPTGVVDAATWAALAARSRTPTLAELNNTDIGAWFVAPSEPAFMMELQHRLKQAGLYQGALDGVFNDTTRQAIAAWRTRIGLPASEVLDERTWTPLIRRTRLPRYADLFSAPPASSMTQQLDPRCTTGRVVCISRQQKKMSLVDNGKIRFTREARFAMPGWESAEGEFRIWYMNHETVSKIFGERTPMPYALFYDRNVAVHYSQDFADKGYGGGSHGCSQLRDYQVAKWLYEQVKVGDRVIVY